ncbi:MAG: Lysine--tRNA ligase [Methanomassiliicoccales archaeon PtaU1.Bin124]|nr:MAG: Lysine--tRNA ligase [Methanomassiliicoccales archaeon PtaU1.Bin124]
MHWADVIANEVIKKGGKHLISTGISPSGFIHVGSLREAITANAVFKAMKDKGADVELIYLVDDYDPLRKRYPFLPECYEKEVGRPLCQIPCPGDHCHESYGHHFIQPFLDAIGEMGIKPHVYFTHELYEQGRFAELTDLVIREKDKVAQILKEVTGRDVPPNFWPVSPQCPECGHFTDKVTGYEYPYVHFKCGCGHEGKADIRKGEAKLPWRIEWAAKWKILGVTCEPFGKDHAAAGGSYETGERFSRDLFGIEPPFPIPYEFIQFKGKGQMHKSTGIVVTGTDALMITPAPVLSFSVLRYNPERHIDYDPGLGILDVVDEYDQVEAMYFNGGAEDKDKDFLRAYEIAQPKCVRTKLPLHVPYRHLVSLVQISDGFEGIVDILKRTENVAELLPEDREVLQERVNCVKHWLANFAPEDVKFSVAAELPQMTLSDQDKVLLRAFHDALAKVEWKGDNIHNAVYECAKGAGVQTKVAFQLLYGIFINKKQGPRLGYFLSTLDRNFVLDRIAAAMN